jgi:hypothetical protein
MSLRFILFQKLAAMDDESLSGESLIEDEEEDTNKMDTDEVLLNALTEAKSSC